MTTYRIAWRSKITGEEGHGEYVSLIIAQEGLEMAKCKWGKEIAHWLEAKPQCE